MVIFYQLSKIILGCITIVLLVILYPIADFRRQSLNEKKGEFGDVSQVKYSSNAIQTWFNGIWKGNGPT